MTRTGFATFFIAAAALTLIAAQTVRADESTNGVKLNGMSENGIKLNGQSENGIRLNGVKLNGQSENGRSLNGRQLNGQSGNGTAADSPVDAPNTPLDAVKVQSITTPDAKH